MSPRLRAALIAEMIGSFGLTFIGIMAIHHGAAGAGLLSVAVAHGLTLAIMVTATMPASGGHLNPAVTAGFMATGKVTVSEGLAYILAQLIGGVVAALLAYVVAGGGIPGAMVVHDGTPTINPLAHVPVAGAVLAEVIATFFLVIAVWGSAVDPRHPNVGGFAIGLMICADILAVGPITGASMNPQRSFGPTLVASLFGQGQGLWGTHWVYWLGPVVGGCTAAMVYQKFLWPRDDGRL